MTLKKRIIAVAAAAAMALGTVTVLPAAVPSTDAAMTVSAAEASTVYADYCTFMPDTSYDEPHYQLRNYVGKGGDLMLVRHMELDSRGNKLPYELISVGSQAFMNNNNVTSVTFAGGKIPWRIESKAFYGCTKLKKVVFQGSVEYIDEEAFANCPNLEEIVFADDLGDRSGYSSKDGARKSAFAFCPKLKSFRFNKTSSYVSNIGELAFNGCISLKKVILPDNVAKIKKGAFVNCLDLDNVTLPAKVELEDNAFGFMFDRNDNYYLADGKTKVKIYYLNAKGSLITENKTQKAITLALAKGSPAEEWAKENDVAYKYSNNSMKGKGSTDSGSKSNSASGSAKLDAPKNLTSKAAKDSITISWDAVGNAKGYRVYKYDPSTKKYEKYKDVTKTSCAVSGLKSGTKYQFKVASLSKSGDSYTVEGTSKAITASTKK